MFMMIMSFLVVFMILSFLSDHCLQPIGNIAERFQALCLKDSGVLYEDPYIQVCSQFCSLDGPAQASFKPSL